MGPSGGARTERKFDDALLLPTDHERHNQRASEGREAAAQQPPQSALSTPTTLKRVRPAAVRVWRGCGGCGRPAGGAERHWRGVSLAAGLVRWQRRADVVKLFLEIPNFWALLFLFAVADFCVNQVSLNDFRLLPF